MRQWIEEEKEEEIYNFGLLNFFFKVPSYFFGDIDFTPVWCL